MRSDERASSLARISLRLSPSFLFRYLLPLIVRCACTAHLRQAEYKSMVELHNKYSAQGFGECEPVACPVVHSVRLSQCAH